MKKIGFVQVNFRQGPVAYNAHYLPYSAGIILSYALSHDHIKSQWKLADLIWRRDPIESTAQQLKHNDIVAFSTYVWNRRYSYALAERVKELNPDCVIVFGGPEPAITDPKLFEKHPFMDLVIVMEGEITFKRVLEAFGTDYRSVPGLLINQDGAAIDTGPSERINNLEEIPSPYLTGIFDQIIADNPGVTWNATLESNRGCPYQCTFCDWGSLTYNKVKKFNLERVFDELDWIGRYCGFVTLTDANFGMFMERDSMIADKLIEVQHRYGRLTNFTMTWAKNQKNDVVKLAKRLMENSPRSNTGLTVSVQSMDQNVLENIKRKNLDQHKIDEIFAICDRENIPVYTELILGLPGETELSWKENFWKILRAGNHYGISILHAALIENAEMNLVQKKLWRLEHTEMWDYMSGTYSHGEVEESLNIVVGTRDISRAKMLDLMVWNSFIQTFHINGLTTYVARFLARRGIDYSDFYNQLYEYICQDPWFVKEFADTKFYYQRWTEQGRVAHPKIGNVEIMGWNLHNRTTLNLYAEQRMDHVYDLVENFIAENYNIKELSQLMLFQKSSLIDYNKLKHMPMMLNFDYDFFGYILDDTELNVPTTFTFESKEDHDMTFEMFLEQIWYSRKRNFHKLRVSKQSLVLEAV